MAFHLAERYERLSGLTGRALRAAEAELEELVLRFWEHRRGAPTEATALERFEAIERALQHLDPERGAWGYYGQFDPTSGPTTNDIEVNAALKLAISLDQTARALVGALVRYAAATSEDAERPWVEAVVPAKVDPSELILRLRGDVAPERGDSAAETAQAAIRERAKSLTPLVRALAKLGEQVRDS